jgi:hypothetical protein
VLIIMIKNIKTYGTNSFQMNGSGMILYLYVFKFIRKNLPQLQYFFLVSLLFGLTSLTSPFGSAIKPELNGGDKSDIFPENIFPIFDYRRK